MHIRAVDEYNSDGHLVYAENFPGAFARGKTRAEAMQKLPLDVRLYCLWSGGSLPDEGSRIELVQEKESGLKICDADSDVIFDAERLPLTEERYLRLKSLALRSARDFLQLYLSIPDKDGTVLSPRETFYGPTPITAREMYEHTKNVNDYYFGEIGIAAENGPDIYACRAKAFDTLESTPDFLINAVFDGSYNESWSLAKVLRRFLWHDRIHARAMYRMASRLCGAESISDPFGFGGK